MNGDTICADLYKFRDVPFRPLDQKVQIQNQVRGLAQTSDDRLAHADVGHKVPVHHIDVNDGRPSLFN